MSNIKLSRRHGVNPSLAVCYYCLKETGEIVLAGRLPGDKQAPRRAVWGNTPCEECQGWMDKGVILISVSDDAQPTDKNPHRTGPWTVVSEDYVRNRMGVKPEIAENLLITRWSFVPDSIWDALGLSRPA